MTETKNVPDKHISDETNSVDDGLENSADDGVSEEPGGGGSSNTEEEGSVDDGTLQDDPETFPRSYVQKLRDENAKYRQRASRADDLAARLHTALVSATGRLADPEDLDYTPEHLDDPDALSAAVDDLLARKPHLASRTPRGNVGQGERSSGGVDLAGILRAAAG